MSASAAAPGIKLRRRRGRRNALATAGMIAAFALTIGPLFWIVAYVGVRGIEALYPGFFVKNPPGNPSLPGGGFFNGIVGTLEIVAIAFVVSAPLGVATAIYLNEHREARLASAVRFAADMLTGVPTIVVGAFVYALWVLRFGFSGIAGAIALAIVMLPLIVRSAEEALRLVPQELREASFALGAREARTILRVVLPAASPGIITGMVLAIARGAGETAPLLLTALGNDLFTVVDPTHRMSTLSLEIFNNAISGFRAGQARAWAGALTLMTIVLICTLAARRLGRRSSS